MDDLKSSISSKIREAIQDAGLEIEGELDVQFYQRWDTHTAKLVVEGWVRRNECVDNCRQVR